MTTRPPIPHRNTPSRADETQPKRAKGAVHMDRLLARGRILGLPANVAAMSESAMDGACMEWANQFGWELTYHVVDSRVDKFQRGIHRVNSGFPDRVWAHLRWHRCVVVELKDLLRPVEDHQAKWLSCMAAAGWEVGVWRPSDLDEAFAVFRNDLRLRAPEAKSAWRG